MTSYGFKMALPTELLRSPGYVFFKQVTKKKGKKLRRALESKGIFNKNNGQKYRLVVRVPCNSTGEGPARQNVWRGTQLNHKTTFLFINFLLNIPLWLISSAA